MLKNKDIICVTLSDWDEPKRSRHHLMSILARHNRVLFVERPVSLLGLFKGKVEWKRLFKAFQGIRKGQPGLLLFAPPPILPGGDWLAWINWVNQKILAFAVRRAAAKINFVAPILWIFAYNSGGLVGNLGESLAIYYCNDPFVKFAPAGRRREGLREIERKLVRRADLVFVTSHLLLEDKKQSNQQTYLIPHAVSQAFLDRQNSNLPQDIAKISQPRIGYIGVIHGMMDFELIEHLATNRQDWQIVFVGPIAEGKPEDVQRFKALCKLQNVHYLGGKEQSELPDYAQAMDVCLIPLADSKVKETLWLPLKFFEYLAAGKPIVSSMAMQGAQDYPAQIVRITGDKAEFVVCVEQALKENSAEHVKARLALARQNTWEERLARIADLIK